MLKPIKYIEVSLNKPGTKEKGLFLNYDAVTKMVRLVLDGKNTTGTFSLAFITVSSILVVNVEGLMDSVFNASDGSQKLAIEMLLELSEQLKKENKVNASGFVNIAAYKDVPVKYTKDATIVLPMVRPSTYANNTIIPPPKIGFLTTKPISTATYLPAKKIIIIYRKSELPTSKLLAAMKKKAAAACLNNYKLKAEPLSEEDTDIDVDKAAEDIMKEAYGNSDWNDEYGYAGAHGMHGRMM